jgi:hypothetical protein
MVKKTFAPLKRQLAKAYPLTEAIAIDTTTEGMVILTEFQNPRDNPSQLSPVQAWLHALTQGSYVISRGSEKIFPKRISGMPLTDVTNIT